jgi:hypothetical protein
MCLSDRRRRDQRQEDEPKVREPAGRNGAGGSVPRQADLGKIQKVQAIGLPAHPRKPMEGGRARRNGGFFSCQQSGSAKRADPK